jgi:hypothetical protein
MATNAACRDSAMTAPCDPTTRRASLRRWVFYGTAALLLVGGLLVLPCVVRVRDSEGWVRSQVRLKQIGLALRQYHEQYGRLPPAIVRGKNDQPLYSWRVLLLPYLEQERLYEDFHLDEPWDSPHNRVLLEETPRCYEPALGGLDLPGLTRYQVFVGPRTAFEQDDFPDGLTDIILVAEAATPVHWSKPVDLEYAPDKPLPSLGSAFSQPVHVLCYEVQRKAGFNACFADGSCRFIGSTTDEKTVRGLITRSGTRR